VALPNAEFLELYNSSEKNIQLENWIISDASNSETSLNNYILKPNGYLILTSNSNVIAFQAFGDVMGLTSFPSLNNNGDDFERQQSLVNKEWPREIQKFKDLRNVFKGVLYER